MQNDDVLELKLRFIGRSLGVIIPLSELRKKGYIEDKKLWIRKQVGGYDDYIGKNINIDNKYIKIILMEEVEK